MTQRHFYPFRTIRGTSDISFNSSENSSAQLLALQSSALGRVFPGPSSRTVRLSNASSLDYHVKFGSTLVVAESTNSMFLLGGTVETFHVEPGQSHISIVATADAIVNITLGHGE